MPEAPAPRTPLSVRQPVVTALAAAAASEVPGVVSVARGDTMLLRWLSGPAVRTELRDGRIDVHVWLLARRGEALPELARRVRSAVARAVERQMGLRLGEVTAIVDGVRG